MSRIYINDEWIFEEEYTSELHDAEYPMHGKMVRLPHTCKELPLHYFDEQEYQMVCGYRKKLFVPEEWRGKSIELTMEGVAHSAWVYLNGALIGEHHCGYTAFTIGIDEKLNYGEENILVIRVDSREKQNIPPFGYVVDYMTYGGIYRDVYLDVREQAHIADVFARSEIDDALLAAKAGDLLPYAVLRSDLIICGMNSDISSYTVRQYLLEDTLDNREHITNMAWMLEHAALVYEGNAQLTLNVACEVRGVRLWSVEHPNLYWVVTVLSRGDDVLDMYPVRLGFRKAEFRKDGFYLNGEKCKLRGLNRHQSYPYVGYAMPESMQKLDADILKNELGCNAVRTSHYPQSHYFIDRCDEIGLLVFTEFPGWQHIGNDAWKEQAVENAIEMVRQYRNHTSIILWGVRINESQDDEAFYRRTNAVVHELDDSRPTGGVRAHKKSQLLEDVYTYNDFVHDGKACGCEPKKKVTSDMQKPYLISEYNGHMYPTKAFDWEEHRVWHAIRHANVLDAVAAQPDIAGSFGWCMFDYNTHKDFGSGDRVCYHGVMDMFRNPKLAALIYACQQEKHPVLELSSTMDIGEHPGCNRCNTYIFTNAPCVRMYKNDVFIKEYKTADSAYQNMLHGPILIDDFIGQEIHNNEKFTKHQADIIKYALNYTALHGYGKYPAKIIGIALQCLTVYHMKPEDAVRLYNKYIGDWGGTSTVYRFEAVVDGKVVKTITKEPMRSMHLAAEASAAVLKEHTSYDVAEVRIRAEDNNGNQLYFFNEPLALKVSGPIELIGPDMVGCSGGMTAVYVKTTGEIGAAQLTIGCAQAEAVTIDFEIQA